MMEGSWAHRNRRLAEILCRNSPYKSDLGSLRCLSAGLDELSLHYIPHYFRVISQLQFFKYARTVGTYCFRAQ
jgi:hypothetical protein